MSRALIVALLCSAGAPVLGQGAPPAIQQALNVAAAGKTDSAAGLLEGILAQGRAGTPRAAQELLGLYARTKRLDDAYRVFTVARSVGTDFSSLAIRPDIANLRGDRRFAALFPDSTVFAHPFVENVRIIHEWRGEPGDVFGWIARGIGDVDGDRVNDVVISSVTTPPLGAGQGKLAVYSGRSGKLIWQRTGETNAALGSSVEAAGDVDRDGVPDVIAGSPGVGVAQVLSGKDGHEILRLTGGKNEANFGGAVSGAGDVDGDGFADVIVGASGTSERAASAGRAIIYSGKTGARLFVLDGEKANDAFGSAVAGGTGKLVAVGAPGAGASSTGRVYIYDSSLKNPFAAPRFVENADATGSSLGAMFLAIVGDVDGDAAPDVYASDYTNSGTGSRAGRVYVYSGRTGKTVLTASGERAGETLGTSASRAGDLDGDGRDDLAVGAWQFSGAAWSGGRITVYSGRDGHVLRHITGQVPGETLGFDSVGIGDVDGDGIPDLLITSAYSMVNGARSGRVYVVAGERP